ncbi:thioredoxin family protein [Thiohalobacter sp. IOR34]|uniref:thioredoxin family protein n=1 Tax=Thiohalobacter sp. IOR34 TaxID=3057176 RepID=UPI0025B24299|nr:thioredoxin family protein [Thiohalobacter sp. IOR34]WJW75166.1 thioredoxin family protein [Thiohalobacter sp. IOR34]
MLARLDQFDFHARLGDLPGASLVIFTAPSCGACRQWRRLLESYHRDHPALRLFEVDAAEDQALAREFDVYHLPALFLYLDGEFHSALQCEAQPAALEAAIDAALAGPGEEAP